MREKQLIIDRANKQYLFEGKNKYIDFCMSSGAMLLGHSNKVFLKAIDNQKTKGSNFNCSNINENEYKKLLKISFPEMNNFIFSNSGSEANIRALRIARSITNKNKVCMVNGSWHGSVDNFLFDLKKNKIESMSSGVSSYKKNTLIIPYNNIEVSKKILNKNYNEIAAIIIEPIQCSIPTVKSVKYLRFLKSYCDKKKIIMCFDEVITGMRIKELAIYKKYNFTPDIVTFAKCFGGGLPIGITSYTKKIENKIKKLNKKIFFGGTFSGNPLSTKVGFDTFKYVKKNKNKIYDHLETLTILLITEVNDFCKKNNFNFHLQNFESIVRPIFDKDIILNRSFREKFDPKSIESNKLKKFLLKEKIYISGNHCFFISYCHSKKDIITLIKVLKKFLITLIK